MRLPRIWKRCASGSARHCEDSGQRLSPSWRGAWSRRAGHVVGRVGRPCRGRCKYVPVSSVAASMRLTPLHGLPTLPSTVSCGRPPRKKERRATAGRALRLLGAEHGSALQGQCRTKQKGRGERRVLFVFHQFVSNPMLFLTVTGKLSGVGRCGLAGPLAPRARGMPRAGWAGRPTPVLPCAQDSAHEQGAIEPPGVRALCLRSTASQAPERTAASGWAGPRSGVHGVSCQPTPPHPTSSNPEPLWLWLWLWLWLSAVDVARRRRTTARQRGASTSNPIGQLTPVPPMPQ